MKEGTIKRPKSQASRWEIIFSQHNRTHAGSTKAALSLQKVTSNKQLQFKWKSRHKRMHGLDTTICQTLRANYSIEHRPG